jgi:hypothetical protein
MDMNVVQSPVRPSMRWMREVSIASARVIAGRRVVSRRASLMVKIQSYRDKRNFTFRPFV